MLRKHIAHVRREDIDGPEIYSLYMMAAIGGIVMGAANDLIVLFLGLEILSIALYVLAASHRKRIQSQEAGLKYFVLGSFSSAIAFTSSSTSAPWLKNLLWTLGLASTLALT